MGRHSDNKMKQKKGPIGRPSLDQRQPIKLAQIQQQVILNSFFYNFYFIEWKRNFKKICKCLEIKKRRTFRYECSAKGRGWSQIWSIFCISLNEIQCFFYHFQKLKKEIRGLLNKITPSTYDEVILFLNFTYKLKI